MGGFTIPKGGWSRMLRLTMCLLSLVVLATLPAERPHQFRVHYRTAQVRRTFERHADLAHSGAGPSERVAHEASIPSLFPWLRPDPAPAARISRADSVVLAPNPRLLLRLKLGPPSGNQDPLV
jgi:hypothetical protein